MKIVIKRFVAYAIDILIVSMISSLITSNTLINKDFNTHPIMMQIIVEGSAIGAIYTD